MEQIGTDGRMEQNWHEQIGTYGRNGIDVTIPRRGDGCFNSALIIQAERPAILAPRGHVLFGYVLTPRTANHGAGCGSDGSISSHKYGCDLNRLSLSYPSLLYILRY